MGGRAAIRRMRAAASARGAKVLEGSVVPRMFRDVPAMMAREAARIVNLFGGAA